MRGAWETTGNVGIACIFAGLIVIARLKLRVHAKQRER